MSLILLYMIFLRNRMVHIKEPVPYCPIVKGLVCVIYLLSARRNKKKKKKDCGNITDFQISKSMMQVSGFV